MLSNYITVTNSQIFETAFITVFKLVKRSSQVTHNAEAESNSRKDEDQSGKGSKSKCSWFPKNQSQRHCVQIQHSNGLSQR